MRNYVERYGMWRADADGSQSGACSATPSIMGVWRAGFCACVAVSAVAVTARRRRHRSHFRGRAAAPPHRQRASAAAAAAGAAAGRSATRRRAAPIRGAPTEATLGFPIYPDRAVHRVVRRRPRQRYYIFGATAPYADSSRTTGRS